MSEPTLLELSARATPGRWEHREGTILAPSTNPSVGGLDVVVSTAYSDRSHNDDAANLEFITELVERFRAGLLREADEHDGWHPISTAPLDGTRVDVWDGYGRRTDCHYDKDHWVQFVSRDRTTVRYASGFTPTHWRTRPTTPMESTP